MALLLKKVWGSINRPSSSSNSNSIAISRPDELFENYSLGALDQIPIDIMMQIMKILGPKEVARLCLVCKNLRILASDNRLWIFFLQNGKETWDCILFSETYLRFGSPFKTYYENPPQVSFMNIYAQREIVPGSVIIDGGSGYCKYGWSKYASPSGRCATFLFEVDKYKGRGCKLQSGFKKDEGTKMQVKPSSQPLILALPICHSDDTEAARASRRQYIDSVYSVLFDMNVPAVCAIDQAVLALYAAKRTSGIVVNVGFNVTSVVPILRGEVMRDIGVEIIGQGALKLTGFLKELLQRENIIYESLYTVRTIKEKLCYVALDYDLEMKKDTSASCEVAGEGIFTLSKERFQTGEILFQPQLAGLRVMGLHQAVGLCMDHCYTADVASDDSWYKTVVLTGGTACLPGLPERLGKELRSFLPKPISEGIKVIPPPYGTDSAWFGAKIVSNVSTFMDGWCMSKKQFRQKYKRSTSSLLGSW